MLPCESGSVRPFGRDQNLRWLDTPASGLFDLSFYRRATNSATADDVTGPASNPVHDKTWLENHDPILLGGRNAHGHDSDGDLEWGAGAYRRLFPLRDEPARPGRFPLARRRRAAPGPDRRAAPSRPPST